MEIQTMTISKKKYVSWQDIENNCLSIVNTIRKYNAKYDCIVSVGRGGMIPSRIISEYLDIRNIYIYNIRSYTDIDQQGKIISEKFDFSALEGKNVLIVDDIYTTGHTLDFVCDSISNNVDDVFITTATLYENSNKLIVDRKPNIYASVYDSVRDWIVFPWENDSLPPMPEIKEDEYEK